jgi:hypothetical protein
VAAELAAAGSNAMYDTQITLCKFYNSNGAIITRHAWGSL